MNKTCCAITDPSEYLEGIQLELKTDKLDLDIFIEMCIAHLQHIKLETKRGFIRKKFQSIQRNWIGFKNKTL